MDAETLDRLCKEAMQRITYYINRMAAQNLRRMRERNESWTTSTESATSQ